jgi:hypothetical protein
LLSIQYICGPHWSACRNVKSRRESWSWAIFNTFQPRLTVDHLNYHSYYMQSTLWCIWDYMWRYGSIQYTFGPARVHIMTWKLYTRADFELFWPYFSQYSAVESSKFPFSHIYSILWLIWDTMWCHGGMQYTYGTAEVFAMTWNLTRAAILSYFLFISAQIWSWIVYITIFITCTLLSDVAETI